MIKWLKNRPIQTKLLFTLLFSSISGLLLTGLLLLVFEVSAFKQNAWDDLTAMANIVANRSTAALLFDDPDLGRENLIPLNQLSDVYLACIYDTNRKVFAAYKVSVYQPEACPDHYSPKPSYFNGTLLHISVPISLENESLGTVSIDANLRTSFMDKIKSLGLLFCVLVGSTIVIFFLTTPLLTLITTPLRKLLATVNKITQDRDFSQRATKQHNDELGKLVDAFNDMVATVEQQNQALIIAKNHYRALYDDNPAMIFNLSIDGEILSVNHFGAQQLNLSSEALQNRSIFDFIYPDDLAMVKQMLNDCLLSPQTVHKQETRKICRDGRIIWVREMARLIENADHQSNFLLVCEDVTETRLLSEQIAYQASHDALTGLVNRSQFDIYIQQAVDNVQTKQQTDVLCYLDLDQFKVVNDTCGHLAGDELLRQLGHLLKLQIRRGDILGRLGGDEFGILMHHCSLDDAYQACTKLKTVIQDFQFGWEDRSYSVGVSIGLAPINHCCSNAVDVLKEADAACYAAKEHGRNRVHIFRPDDEELALRQGEMQWVEKIRQGIELNQFVLYGQLIVPIEKKGEGLHFETLIRYRDENGRIVPPGAFLSAAERYNIASLLDKWVIEHLFDWLAHHPDFLTQLSVCSVNLSGLSMSDETMMDFIDKMFEQYAIPTHKICFEVTETAAIDNLTYAMEFIQHWRQRGCSFSLDDFGSGLSSFAYLKNLPVDYLKIDGLFVKDILDDPVDLAMVKSINEVGHVMSKKTIAEFVENQQILDLLNTLGVDYAQGYGLAKPVPLDELL